MPSTTKNHPAQMTLALPYLQHLISSPENLNALLIFNCFSFTGKTCIYQEMLQGYDLAGITEKWQDDLHDWGPVMKIFLESKD